MTRQRQLILDIVNQSCEHLNAKQIYMLAKFKKQDIAFGTVYNNLNKLVDLGLISRVRIAGMADRFDKILKPHNHLYCLKCNKVQDIEIKDLKSYIKQKSGYDIIGYDLSINYICDECKNNKFQGE